MTGRTRAGSIRNRRPINHDRWLVSYADFTTLLFALFAMMYAFSTIDAQKLSAAAQGMQDAFATAPVSPIAVSPGGDRLPPPIRVLPESSLEDVRIRLLSSLARELAARRLDVGMDRRGLVISIREAGSFGTGSAALTPPVRALIAEIAAVVGAMPNDIRIEGHTDDLAIGSARFASNWELSTARATAVVSYLAQEGGVAPARLSAAGYGEFRPRVPNDSAAGRAQNRRIDLVVLNTATREAEEP